MARYTCQGLLDDFWRLIDLQLEELRTAASADDVLRILGPAPAGISSADAFFGGSGGDGSVYESLRDAGWNVVWIEAGYYWAMRAPNGDVITYIEGDIYRGNARPLPHGEPS